MTKDGYNFCLDKVFKEKTDYVEYTFDVYRQIYDLPLINYTGEVSEELFEYVLKRRFFILLAVYDQDGKIYLERNIQERLYWSLPGGSILKDEDIHSAVRRISQSITGDKQPEISLGEIEPIAFVENEFIYNGKTYKHYGIAFAARLRNKNAIDLTLTQGRFVQINDGELNNINRYANREVAKICNRYIHKFKTSPPEEEISTNEKYKFRYLLHNSLIKRFILTPRLKKKKKFLNLIGSFVEQGDSFIDVSCGDSNVLRDIYNMKNLNYAVANDISWSQINTKQSDGKKVLFTNHHAAYLPFKDDSFDVAFCANTLHHIPSREELMGLLGSCFRIANKVIFVEIENPKDTGVFPYFLNRYWYTGFLKDVGGSYFSLNTFQSVITDFYKGKASVKFGEFRNIQGRYLIAVVTKNAVNGAGLKKIEVEDKYILQDKTVFINKIAGLGFSLSKLKAEKDEYFTDAKGEFVKNRTCLRIRTSDKINELTFKGKSQTLSGSYSKVEHNVEIHPNQLGEIKDILVSLGYHKYVSVNKVRNTFTRHLNGVEQNISIDELQGIGSFVELEILAEYAKWQGRERELKDMLVALKLEIGGNDFVEAPVPYRDYTANYLSKQEINKDHTKAFLFDFDGTIAHTESIFYKSYSKIAQQIGGQEVALEEYAKYELDEHDRLFDHLNLGGKVIKDEFMRLVYDDYRQSLKDAFGGGERLESLEGIKIIRSLGYHTAMVTSSRREFVSILIPQKIQEELFDCIVCREDTKLTKPEPDPYLKCLARLGVDADKCIAVEDSPRGERSAKAAGLKCIIVKGDPAFDRNDNTHAQYVFDNIMELALIMENV